MMSSNTSNTSILIIDDEPDNLENIYHILQKHNTSYDLLKADKATLGLRIAQKWKPNLIVTDWDMPEMTGIELIRELKSRPETADIPIVMVTGVMISPSHLQMALDAGAADYLRKPIDPVELIARVRSMLTLSSELQKVKQLSALKDQIFSIISHDLRSPIQSLSGLLNVFAMGLLSPQEMTPAVEKISTNVRQVSELLDNLLKWATLQVQGGHVQIAHQHLDVKAVINEVEEQLRPAIQQKDIQWHCTLPENSPTFYADREVVKLLLRNLISNAIKFTPVGGSVALVVEQKEDRMWFSIKDSGKGVSPEVKKQLFGSHMIAHQSGTEGEKGIGLGLMLCQSFVEAHEGEIGHTENPEGGSTFWFWLPLHNKQP